MEQVTSEMLLMYCSNASLFLARHVKPYYNIIRQDKGDSQQLFDQRFLKFCGAAAVVSDLSGFALENAYTSLFVLQSPPLKFCNTLQVNVNFATEADLLSKFGSKDDPDVRERVTHVDLQLWNPNGQVQKWLYELR